MTLLSGAAPLRRTRGVAAVPSRDLVYGWIVCPVVTLLMARLCGLGPPPAMPGGT